MKRTLILPLLLVCSSMAAHAGFLVDGGNQAASTTAKPTKAPQRVKVKGDPRGLSLARGMGRDVPAAEAIIQIVPEGFATNFEEIEPQLKIKVTWRGGTEWTHVLEETLTQVGLVADVDLDERTVRVYAPGAKPKEAKAAAKVAPNLAMRVSDKTMRGVLQRWAVDAGWDLSWEADFDYVVPGNKELPFSTFEEGVESVMEGLSGAERPLQALFYDSNRVVRVVPFGTARKGVNNK